jgi:hypothetical protein
MSLGKFEDDYSTAKEFTESNVFPDGEYCFIITAVKKELNTVGNEMVSIYMEVYDGDYMAAPAILWFTFKDGDENKKARQVNAGKLKTLRKAIEREGALADFEDVFFCRSLVGYIVSAEKTTQDNPTGAKPFTNWRGWKLIEKPSAMSGAGAGSFNDDDDTPGDGIDRKNADVDINAEGATVFSEGAQKIDESDEIFPGNNP